jgi:hypothetical protein
MLCRGARSLMLRVPISMLLLHTSVSLLNQMIEVEVVCGQWRYRLARDRDEYP